MSGTVRLLAPAGVTIAHAGGNVYRTDAAGYIQADLAHLNELEEAGFSHVETGHTMNIFRQIADRTLVNSVAEGTLLGSGAPGQSLSLRPGQLSVGSTLKWRLMGFMTNISQPTFRIRVKLGGVVLWDSGVVTLSNLTGNQLFFMEGQATCRSTGPSGTIFTTTEAFVNINSNTLGNLDLAVPTAPVQVDTTLPLDFDITGQWGTASASNGVTTNTFVLSLND